MNADFNPRGGLTVDRDSLHASPEYARQVAAAKQLQERRVNADVEKAVERAEVRNEMRGDSGRYPNGEGWGHCFRVDGFWLPKDAWQTIRQALRDQEAEIANLERRRSHEHIVAENALTLLRECDAVARRRGDKCGLCDSIDNDGQPYQSAHLAAHLGGEHE